MSTWGSSSKDRRDPDGCWCQGNQVPGPLSGSDYGLRDDKRQGTVGRRVRPWISAVLNRVPAARGVRRHHRSGCLSVWRAGRRHRRSITFGRVGFSVPRPTTVTGAQEHGGGFPGQTRPVVDDCCQGIESEVFLPGRHRVFLVRVGRDFRVVDIDD